MSGKARFTRGPITVRVTKRPDDSLGIVRATVAGDPSTDGYRIAYRGRVENVIAALEACTRKLWEIRASGHEPHIEPDPPRQP